MLGVHPSGFYAWRLNHESIHAKEDKRLLVLIKESWLESGSVYGYRQVSDDLRELDKKCGSNRAHRLMRSAGMRSQTGCAKRKFFRQVVGWSMRSRIDRELAMNAILMAVWRRHPKRRHSFSNDLSPVEYEKRYFQQLSSV